MAGKSPVAANEEQKAALRTLAISRDRGEADRVEVAWLEAMAVANHDRQQTVVVDQ